MAGKVKSIRSIEDRILPRMSGSEYIGPEFDPGAQVYRLKFIRDGRVIFVDGWPDREYSAPEPLSNSGHFQIYRTREFQFPHFLNHCAFALW